MHNTEQDEPRYRSRITETPLHQSAPTESMPVKPDTSEWDVDGQRGLSLKIVTILLGGLSVVGFMVFNAIQEVVVQFGDHPVASSLLGVLLGGFIVSLLALIVREWLGFRAVEAYVDAPLDVGALAKHDDVSHVKHSIERHASRFGKDSYAARCYKNYQQAINSDMSVQDITDVYERLVATPVTKKAEDILRKEAVVSGSLAFISPNHLIQTLAISWISFRTIRRIARVFGLRPGTAGSWRLFKVLAQNLAAQSLFDMATDELANQITGSLAARVMENSAEAVAAGALNVRLGRTLIKLLR
ncbi:YcjF family protein [Alteromonas sp. C1M14]|uniref:YcjF family protein n=1 Tax=Alteromonas sp. C1M14 TaxID=2841567 RepID=UPI001C0A3160|nr:YcjF family protein [Alteromonas sp. C1M14]MBU2979934.1 DUF697 domain-containing protein [Alteromonas sp. C1M14]